MKKISPCLWFDSQAVEAARFYATVFPGGKLGLTTHYGKATSAVAGRPEGSVLTQDFEILGLPITALNGGPIFKLNPAISFFVSCAKTEEVDRLWKALGAGGEVRMELGTYPWSPKYGWVSDRFGVDWQIMVNETGGDYIAPSMLFVKEKFGLAQQAVDHYFSVFPNSRVESRTQSEDGKTLVHCAMKIAGQPFVLMDGPGEHAFDFNDAFSFQVVCDDQREIDYFWDKLGDGGTYVECGWLKDKFGVSWQVTPIQLEEIARDPERNERMMVELLKMKKLDLAKLLAAAEGK